MNLSRLLDYTISLSLNFQLRRIKNSCRVFIQCRTDNGPEFTSSDFDIWCKENNITIQFIQPGKPMQNGYIERFNRLYREAVLDAYLFFDLDQVRQLTEEWIIEYNQHRPHESLQNMTPVEWKNELIKKEKLQNNTV